MGVFFGEGGKYNLCVIYWDFYLMNDLWVFIVVFKYCYKI